MRQIAGAFHEYEKARLVAKLKAARERRRSSVGKCEGRKSWSEINPDLVREAKRLRRRSPKGHQRSLREVANELAKLGYKNERGTVFNAASTRTVRAMFRSGRWSFTLAVAVTAAPVGRHRTRSKSSQS
jgi:hypothetical protein